MSLELKNISYNFIILLCFLVTQSSCNKFNLPPVAVLEVFPSFGDTSIIFDFNASTSEDDRNYHIALEYRWDFDGDGQWDTDYNKNDRIAHRYNQAGIYQVVVKVRDYDGLSAIAVDTIEVWGMNQDIDTLIDNRDGNRYRIVKIDGKWWMAENLRYGTIIPDEKEPTDNDTVEMYRNSTNIHIPFHTLDTIGGVYNWFESMKYQMDDIQGICPDGWHLPTKDDWEALFEGYPEPYSLNYYGMSGCSNLNLDLNSGADRWEDGFLCWSGSSGFWSSGFRWKQRNLTPYFCIFFSKHQVLTYDYYWGPSSWPGMAGVKTYLSVRCVKDN